MSAQIKANPQHTRTVAPTASAPRLSYRIAEFSEATGICRTRLYEEISAGRLRTVKLGRCTLVMAEDAQAFLANLRGAA